MTDRVSKEIRSEIMRAVKTKNTGAEMAVRRLVFSMGYRYRLHRKDLPGTPDLVFPSRQKVIFVHGCFWHGHKCKQGRAPKSNTAYWDAKRLANRVRDESVRRKLERAGWRTKTIWECQLRNHERVSTAIANYLGA